MCYSAQVIHLHDPFPLPKFKLFTFQIPQAPHSLVEEDRLSLVDVFGPTSSDRLLRYGIDVASGSRALFRDFHRSWLSGLPVGPPNGPTE